jgi:hypothetical protein
MKRLLFIALLLAAGTVHATYTERYVTSDAAGGGAGTSGDPWTLAEGFAHTQGAGYRVNIKVKGTASYSIGTTTIAQAGSNAQMSVYRGYDAAIGDLDGLGRNADTSLNTTGFPVITLTGILTPSAQSVLKNLSFTGALSSNLVGGNNLDEFNLVSCRVENTQNNASAQAVKSDNNCEFANCEFVCSGAAHGSILDTDTGSIIIGCRFEGVANSAYASMLGTSSLSKSAFLGNIAGSATGLGLVVESYPLQSPISGCTFYHLGTAVQLPSVLNAYSPPVLVNNHATDNGKWIESLYSTGNTAVIEMNNRTRDNVVPYSYIGDGINVGEVTTDTGGIATDYENAGAGNLRLISGAPGEGAGLIAYQDIGAFQREPSAGGGTAYRPRMVIHGN